MFKLHTFLDQMYFLTYPMLNRPLKLHVIFFLLIRIFAAFALFHFQFRAAKVMIIIFSIINLIKSKHFLNINL